MAASPPLALPPTGHNLRVLSHESCEFVYIGEGGANVIYVIRYHGAAKDETSGNEAYNLPLDKVLLRLRKEKPGVTDVVDGQTWWQQYVWRGPWETSEVLSHQLVGIQLRLCGLNEKLAEMERDGTRNAKRHGESLRMARPFGVLVESMLPRSHDLAVFEFKPKWLCQSSTAPADAVRCRTCAITAWRTNLPASSCAPPLPASTFCPLDLVAGDPDALRRAVRILVHRSQGGSTEEHLQLLEDVIVEYFSKEGNVLQKLKTVQEQHPETALTEDVSIGDIQTAMAFRDCSLYVRVSANGDERVVAKLGDLDLKAALKFDHWRVVENGLIKAGWYSGKERTPITTSCRLGRSGATEPQAGQS